MEDTPDLSTGIEGLDADDKHQGLPVFDVSKDEFFANMRKDRTKLSYTSTDKPNQFMSNTYHRKPFYVRHSDENTGKTYLNHIK